MKEFNKPDLNAPRFRPGKHNILTKAFFKRFREKHPKYAGLSDKDIKNVVSLFNGKIWETIITTRDGVELPEQLGNVFIGSCPKKRTANIDYKLSAELGRVIQNTNWESDEHVAKIFYANYENKYKFKFHQLWGFSGVRDFKRSLAQEYPKQWKKYILMDSAQHVSRLFRKAIVKEKLQIENQSNLDTYDEFDLS